MDSNEMNKPVRPNIQTGQKPVRPNVQPGQKPVRPNVQPGQKPVKPNIQNRQTPVRPNVQPSQKPVRPNTQINKPIEKQNNYNINTTGIISDDVFTFSDYTPVTPNIDNDKKNSKKKKEQKAINNSKAPKEKKVKNPKASKEKKVKIPKLDENGEPIPENKVLKYGIIAGCIIGVILVVIIIIKVLGYKSDQHITLADVEPEETIVDVAETNEDEEKTENPVIRPVEDTEEEDYGPVAGTPTDVKVAVGSVITIPITFNTKLEGDSEYKDYYSYITVEYDGMTSGYDSIAEIVAEHNETSKHIVEIPSKEDFYASSDGNELVMYSFTFSIPDDFPTQDTKNNKVFISPSFGMMLEGSEDPESLITDKYVFSVPKLTAVCDDISLLKLGESYSLNWIATMPSGLDDSGYNIYFAYEINGISGKYLVKSVAIPESEYTETEDKQVNSSSDTNESEEKDENTSEEKDENTSEEKTENTSEEKTENTSEEDSNAQEDNGVLN